MKVNVEVSCTPEEARAFFGLPDLEPLQKEMLGVMQERMKGAMAAMDPESILKAWMPGGGLWGGAQKGASRLDAGPSLILGAPFGGSSAMRVAAEFDTKIIIERAVIGREFECAVLGNETIEASIPCEILPSREFYDYEDKYLLDKAVIELPAKLTDEQTAEMRRLAVAACRACEVQGMSRVDFLMDAATGEFFVNEVNTIPGFTSISMYPKMWEYTGVPYSALLDRLIALALERHDRPGPAALCRRAQGRAAIAAHEERRPAGHQRQDHEVGVRGHPHLRAERLRARRCGPRCDRHRALRRDGARDVHEHPHADRGGAGD